MTRRARWRSLAICGGGTAHRRDHRGGIPAGSGAACRRRLRRWSKAPRRDEAASIARRRRPEQIRRLVRQTRRVERRSGFDQSDHRERVGIRFECHVGRRRSGLMQFMPGTAAALGVPTLRSRTKRRGGTRYSKVCSIASGQRKARGRRVQCRAGGDREVPGIPPYAETQNYVANVLSSYEQYRRRDPLERALAFVRRVSADGRVAAPSASVLPFDILSASSRRAAALRATVTRTRAEQGTLTASDCTERSVPGGTGRASATMRSSGANAAHVTRRRHRIRSRCQRRRSGDSRIARAAPDHRRLYRFRRFAAQPGSDALLGRAKSSDGRAIWMLRVTPPAARRMASASTLSTWMVDEKSYHEGDTFRHRRLRRTIARSAARSSRHRSRFQRRP